MTKKKPRGDTGLFFMGFLLVSNGGSVLDHGTQVQAYRAPIDTGKYRSPWTGCDGSACKVRLLLSV